MRRLNYGRKQMTVYSITLNKSEYIYSIKYHCGNDDMQLDTNEEPLASMKLAIGVVKDALRQYAEINDNFNISLGTIKFGYEDKDSSVTAVAYSADPTVYPKKEVAISTKVIPVNKREKSVAEDRARLLLALYDLAGEVAKYLNGERAQRTLELN